MSETSKRCCGQVVLLIIFAFIMIGGIYLFRDFMQLRQKFSPGNISSTLEQTNLLMIAPIILGFQEPQTILVLFQNNTELRPSGGFIGSYAVIKVDKGQTEIIASDGSEILDKQSPKEWKPVPPQPLKDHLGVDRWYFRDSNWSPDFAESAKKALEFYAEEGGANAKDVTLVLAVTPTVIEELLRLVGPVTINEKTFTADNVTEKLQYEVEYGFRERGIAAVDRKDILEPLMREMMKKAAGSILTKAPELMTLGEKMVKEKQILAYSVKSETQKILETAGAAGRVQSTNGDYLMWVDANLGALKTDHAINRSLQYSIGQNPLGGPSNRPVVHTAIMSYRHTGAFDWRTTRYQTYARIFVPSEAVLLNAYKINRYGVHDVLPKEIDEGVEAGKKWFGLFFSVEPGDSQSLQFEYTLPAFDTSLEKGPYTLVVQKQPGTIAEGLTLDLDFGKTISAASPAEEEGEWGNVSYRLGTDLREDRRFEVKF